MQFETVLRCRVPRANCPEHGVKTLRVPWAEPGSRFTLLFERFALEVLQASRSLTQAKELLSLHWDSLHLIMKRAVARGLERRALDEVRYLGLDEKSFLKGQSYISLLNDLEESRVLEVSEGRSQEAANLLYASLSPAQLAEVEAVAIDMASGYVAATEQAVPQAAIVHDKFHPAPAGPSTSTRRWTRCAGRRIKSCWPWGMRRSKGAGSSGSSIRRT